MTAYAPTFRPLVIGTRPGRRNRLSLVTDDGERFDALGYDGLEAAVRERFGADVSLVFDAIPGQYWKAAVANVADAVVVVGVKFITTTRSLDR